MTSADTERPTALVDCSTPPSPATSPPWSPPLRSTPTVWIRRQSGFTVPSCTLTFLVTDPMPEVLASAIARALTCAGARAKLYPSNARKDTHKSERRTREGLSSNDGDGSHRPVGHAACRCGVAQSAAVSPAVVSRPQHCKAATLPCADSHDLSGPALVLSCDEIVRIIRFRDRRHRQTKDA